MRRLRKRVKVRFHFFNRFFFFNFFFVFIGIKNRLEKEENILQEIFMKKISIIEESEKKLSLIKSINQKSITEEM